MTKTPFAIIGAGWRAEFFLRVVRALPDRFDVCGVVARDAAKGKAFEEEWGVRTFRTTGELLASSKPAFVVVSVPHAPAPGVLTDVAKRDVPVLCETPPAPDLAGLRALNADLAGRKVQVAEQYIFQPYHAAILHVIASGKLGTVSQAQVSVAHGYHGVSLLRRVLGKRYENATITARDVPSPVVDGPNRNGPPAEEHVVTSSQRIAHLDFGDATGVFDFDGQQYFSWIRSNRILVRGDRGEINNREVRYLQDHATPITGELVRRDAGGFGNLEGMYHKGFEVFGEWAYRNPYTPGRLTDDEIAVATAMDKMAAYAEGGPSFYSLAEASQDTYLSLMIDEAAKAGNAVTTETQPWGE